MNRNNKLMKRLLLTLALLFFAGLTYVTGTAGGSIEHQANFNFSYNLKIDKIADQSKTVDIWLPLPSNSRYQAIVDYKITAELPYEIQVDSEYGNRLLHFRSEQGLPDNFEITLDLNVIRYEQDGFNQTSTTPSETTADLSRYLAPDILVPIDGPVALEAKQAVNESMTNSQKIEALYYHLIKTMKYDKSGIGWGNGDALYACESRKGNCTDIHSLFIGMSRSLNIPSRFIVGFPLPNEKRSATIPGYHCWAEFYLDDIGWLPVDIIEAIKHPEKEKYFFGHVDQNRVAFSIGRDIRLGDETTSPSLNYFIYPYLLVDGIPSDKISYSFSYAPVSK